MTRHTSPNGHRYSSGPWTHDHIAPSEIHSPARSLGAVLFGAIGLALGMLAVVAVVAIGPQHAAKATIELEGMSE